MGWNRPTGRTLRRSAATVFCTSLVVTSMALVLQASPANASCPPDPSYTWKKGGASYNVIGATAGEYNAGNVRTQLSYDKKTEKTASTTVSADASFSVDAGIASVDAQFSISVTKSFTSGTLIHGSLWIPPKESGKLQPSAQITKFVRWHYWTTPTCQAASETLGTLKAITSVPFFLSCVGAATCTPHA
jgi:hypothetical protein